MMSTLAAAAGMAIIVAMLSLVIGKQAPGISFAMTLTAGILILLSALQGLRGILDTLREVLAAAEIESTAYLPVIKAVGIAVIVRIAAELCRDAGQSSLAAKLELTGALAAITVSLPLFRQVLDMVAGMLGTAG